MVNLRLVDVILEALAQAFNPGARYRAFRLIERAQHRLGQGAAGPVRHAVRDHGLGLWRRQRPRRRDSATATHLSNLHTTPIEILESEFPCRITRFDLVPDSGGAGSLARRLSMQREYELLENATVIRRFNKSRFPPNGLAAGKSGAPARFVIRLGTAEERTTQASGRFEMVAGERFLLQSAGGGGYGDPTERDRLAFIRDVIEGYVTRRQDYED